MDSSNRVQKWNNPQGRQVHYTDAARASNDVFSVSLEHCEDDLIDLTVRLQWPCRICHPFSCAGEFARALMIVS